MMKVVVTGHQGLLGWHAATQLHASNCAAKFAKRDAPYELVLLDRNAFQSDLELTQALAGAGLVLHFAGVNRAAEIEMEDANPAIARRLAKMCRIAASEPHVVYANSTHATTDTPYGRSKRKAAEIISSTFASSTNLILPHIFGECARPNYNNVTATLIDKLIKGEKPEINPEGKVNLFHAGKAAEVAIQAGLDRVAGTIAPQGRNLKVIELYEMLEDFHQCYSTKNTFPDLRDDFAVDLFNSYRVSGYPTAFPRVLELHSDNRGVLFEAYKGGGGGQSFVSWTEPGLTRGNHFHLRKVERFLVLKGQAQIQVRRVLRDTTWNFDVSGDVPAVVDMPTLHTHNIKNVGQDPLLTMFWTHDIFNPAHTDTYFDPV